VKEEITIPVCPGGIKYVIHTQVGISKNQFHFVLKAKN
jgi:hypothetical protein